MRKRIAIIAAAVIIVAAAGVGITAYILRGGAVQAVNMNLSDLSVGEKYLAELKYEQAAATLQRVITVEPNNAEAYLALAKTYRYMGDIDAARQTLENGYAATDSAIIERSLYELNEAAAGGEGLPAESAAASVEIAGRFYPSDATELILRGSALTGEDMQRLAEFTKLERLDISGSGISDISAVGKIASLKKFYAANNSISDISALANLPAIEYIGLRGNKIANADSLFSIGSLKYLHLSDNQISRVPKAGGGLLLLYLAGNNVAGADVSGDNLLYCDISEAAGR